MSRQVLAAFLFFGLFACNANSQWLESTIRLPDTMTGVSAPVQFAYNSANGLVYVSNGNGYDSCIIVFNASTGVKIAKITLGIDAYRLCSNPARNKVYVSLCGADSVAIVDGATNQVVARVGVGHYSGELACDAAGTKVYCANYSDATVTVLDGFTNQIRTVIPVGSGPTSLACNPVTNKLYCGCPSSHTLTVIDTRTDSVIAAVPVQTSPRILCVNPVRNKIYCCSSLMGDSLVVVDGATDSVKTKIPIAGLYGDICYNPANDQVYAISGYWHVYAIDGTADTVLVNIEVPDYPMALKCDSSLNKVYCLCQGMNRGDEEIAVIKGESNEVVRDLPTGLFIQGLAAVPAVHRVFCLMSGMGRVKAFDTQFDSLAGMTLTGRFDPDHIAYNPVSNHLYAASGGACQMLAVNASTGQTDWIAELPDRTGAMCFNPLSNKVYSAYGDAIQGSISILDGATGSLRAVFRTNNEPWRLAWDTRHNHVYCTLGDSLLVIDGTGDSICGNIRVDSSAFGIACDSVLDRVYVGHAGHGLLTVVDGASDSVIAIIPLDSGWADQVCCNSMTHRVYTTDYYGHVNIIDADSLRVRRSLKLEGTFLDIACNTRNNRIYLPGDAGYRVAVIDGDRDTILTRVESGSGASRALWEPGHNKLYVTNTDAGTVGVIDCATNRISRIRVGLGPAALASDPAQSRVFVANSWDGTISVLRDSLTGVADLWSSNPPRPTLAISPNPCRGFVSVQVTAVGSSPGVSGVPEEDGKRDGLIGIQIHDVAGRRVKSLDVPLSTLRKPQRVDLSNLPDGVYFMALAGAWAGHSRQKIVVQR